MLDDLSKNKRVNIEAVVKDTRVVLCLYSVERFNACRQIFVCLVGLPLEFVWLGALRSYFIPDFHENNLGEFTERGYGRTLTAFP